MSNIAWIAHPLILSVKALFCSFLLLISIGLAIAYFLAFSKAKFKKIVEILVIFPLIFPPIATGFLLLYVFGKSGFIGSALNLDIVFNFSSLVIAAFLVGLPLFVKPVCASFELFPKSLIEAAQILGKNRVQIFLLVILPSSLKTLGSALILALSRGLGEVGITLMLGGNIVGKTDTLGLAIYNAVYDSENERALILSVLLVIFSLILFFAISLLDKKQNLSK